MGSTRVDRLKQPTAEQLQSNHYICWELVCWLSAYIYLSIYRSIYLSIYPIYLIYLSIYLI